MKFLWLDVCLGELSTQVVADTDVDADTNEDDNDDIRRTVHDYIGSQAFMPNKPKSSHELLTLLSHLHLTKIKNYLEFKYLL